MVGRILFLVLAFGSMGPSAWAQQDQAAAVTTELPDNALLARMFADDQASRSGMTTRIDPAVVTEDAARRHQVRRMLDAGEVRTATDYWHAAFIFQHGDRPDDYLLAHALATTAIVGGRSDAAWIAAATLDRYLQSIGRDQIYGTQFQMPFNDGEPVTQGAYDPALISDPMREASRVPNLAAQRRQIESYEARLSQ